MLKNSRNKQVELLILKTFFFSFWKPKSRYFPNEMIKNRSLWAKRGEYPGRFCTTLSLDPASKQPRSLKTAHNVVKQILKEHFHFLLLPFYDLFMKNLCYKNMKFQKIRKQLQKQSRLIVVNSLGSASQLFRVIHGSRVAGRYNQMV